MRDQPLGDRSSLWDVSENKLSSLLPLSGRKVREHCTGWLITVLLVGMFVASAEGAGRKQLVYHGWELLSATTEDVWRNRDKFATTGADGIAFPIDGESASGDFIRGRYLMTGSNWTDAAFATTVRQVSEATKCPGLSESLALMFWSPLKRLDWRDDAAWNRFAANAEVLARVARVGGLRGFLIDHEDYCRTRQFSRLPADAPYDELVACVRARGRQVFQSMLKGFPDARFLSFWFFSCPHGDIRSANPAAVNAARGDLWPAFLNGALDVLPETTRFIDGCETIGYRADATVDGFRAAYWEPAKGALPLVAAENRAKYSKVLSVSFGQYLDMYVNPPGPNKHGETWYFDPLGGSRLSRFAHNLSSAFAVADDCIWVYGEKGTLIDWDRKDGNFSSPTWESQLPGLRQVFRAAVGDFAYFAQEAESGRLANLVANGGCDASDGKVPKPFGCYTDEKNPSATTFAWNGSDGAANKGSLLLRGEGCFTFGSDGTIKPGDRVYVSIAVKGRRPLVNVIWRSRGSWNWNLDTCYLASEPKDCDDWRTVECLRVVPEGADGIGFTLGGDANETMPVSFDDIGAYKLTGGVK